MRPYNLFVVGTACLGGFLFGYYMAIISGALLFISSTFQFSLAKESTFVSILLLGAILGSSMGGYLTDKIGRKKVFFIASSLLILGTLLLVETVPYFSLLAARVVQGLGIGLISVAVPLYLGEISATNQRGRVVCCYQIAMGLGILTAYIVNYFFTPTANWHSMFRMGWIPAFLQVICIFFIPESPLWLLGQKREDEALKSLKRLSLPWREEAELDQVQARPKVLKFLLFIGILLSVFQQITGINTIIYYAPRIFHDAGYTSELTAALATVSLGLVNLLGSFFSLWLLDRVGRKKLLLTGIIGMFVSLMSLSIFALYDVSFIDKLSIISLISYVLFFGIGLGPVTWVLLSEIYPPQIRDRAMSLCLFANWLCVYIVLLTFPYLLDWIRIEGTFAIYGIASLLAFLFVYKFFPETKQKTLAEIASLFDRICK